MLRISKLTDYGTVILACLASPADRLWTAAEVAERTRLGLPTVVAWGGSLWRGVPRDFPLAAEGFRTPWPRAFSAGPVLPSSASRDPGG